ncbi:MAG: hypothetical protein R2698_09550 [Microthrixaceae bacterium]
MPLLVATVLVALFAVAFTVRRRHRAARREAARTVSLTVVDGVVRRTLGDGRTESAVLDRVNVVELYRTPVHTADGATAFLMLSESIDPDTPRGCLVPLGVDLGDPALEVLMARGLVRAERLDAAMARRAPSRETLWVRPEE